jgi:SpoVK/Ycf46/Vps4 family AAA+-type ATPase
MPTLDDLIVPQNSLRQLHSIASRTAEISRRAGGDDPALLAAPANGSSVLFQGPSGTGKELAAQTLANQLGVPLVRVDLSTLVSEQIGETQMNIDRLFETVERDGSVLLLDEADALFGKRSDVKDDHDRHASIEADYLLQRMAKHKGLVILTTNVPQEMDPAFSGRMTEIVRFSHSTFRAIPSQA